MATPDRSAIVAALACAAAVFVPSGASAQGDPFVLKPSGYVQVDYRSFRNWDAAVGEIGLARDERELRRLRLGLQGSFRALRFEVDTDVSDADDALDANDFVKDAFVELRLSRTVRLRAGQFKLPFDEEQLESASRTDFAERSLFAMAVGPGRDLGVMARGRLGRRYRYEAGLFAGDGRTEDSRSDTTAAVRLVFAPVESVRVAAGATFGGLSEADTGAARGLLGSSVSGYRFFSPHHVAGRRSRGVLNSSWSRGRFAFKGTVGLGRDGRRGQGSDFADLPALASRGWVASAHWLMAGERADGEVDPGPGLFRGTGAVEASVRLEALSFDDVGSDGTGASPSLRASDVRAASARALTLGVSWWPTRFTRLLGNASLEHFSSGEVAPEPGRRGNYLTVSARVQVRLPR